MQSAKAMKRNETKRNETKRNETKTNEKDETKLDTVRISVRLHERLGDHKKNPSLVLITPAAATKSK